MKVCSLIPKIHGGRNWYINWYIEILTIEEIKITELVKGLGPIKVALLYCLYLNNKEKQELLCSLLLFQRSLSEVHNIFSAKSKEI